MGSRSGPLDVIVYHSLVDEAKRCGASQCGMEPHPSALPRLHDMMYLPLVSHVDVLYARDFPRTENRRRYEWCDRMVLLRSRPWKFFRRMTGSGLVNGKLTDLEGGIRWAGSTRKILENSTHLVVRISGRLPDSRRCRKARDLKKRKPPFTTSSLHYLA